MSRNSASHSTSSGAKETLAGPGRPSLSSGRHTGDRLAAAAVFVLSLVILRSAVSYGMFDDNQPGPGLFPGVIASALLVLSFLWFLTGRGPAGQSSDSTRDRMKDPVPLAASELLTSQQEDGEPDLPPIDASGARTIALVIAWTAVPLLLLERIGFILTITIYVGGMLIFVARARPWIALSASAVVAFVTALGGNAVGIRFPDPLGLLQLVGV